MRGMNKIMSLMVILLFLFSNLSFAYAQEEASGDTIELGADANGDVSADTSATVSAEDALLSESISDLEEVVEGTEEEELEFDESGGNAYGWFKGLFSAKAKLEHRKAKSEQALKVLNTLTDNGADDQAIENARARYESRLEALSSVANDLKSMKDGSSERAHKVILKHLSKLERVSDKVVEKIEFSDRENAVKLKERLSKLRDEVEESEEGFEDASEDGDEEVNELRKTRLHGLVRSTIVHLRNAKKHIERLKEKRGVELPEVEERLADISLRLREAVDSLDQGGDVNTVIDIAKEAKVFVSDLRQRLSELKEEQANAGELNKIRDEAKKKHVETLKKVLDKLEANEKFPEQAMAKERLKTIIQRAENGTDIKEVLRADLEVRKGKIKERIKERVKTRVKDDGSTELEEEVEVEVEENGKKVKRIVKRKIENTRERAETKIEAPKTIFIRLSTLSVN